MELRYRTALITGASSGIGRGLATWFARRGVTVYAAARRGAELEALAREVAAGPAGASSSSTRGTSAGSGAHDLDGAVNGLVNGPISGMASGDAGAGRTGRIVPLVLDVADAQATRQRLRAAGDECGGLDLVIANAAIALETPASSLTWDSVAAMIDVNVRGAAATLTATLDRMVERRSGHLVGISSLAAARGAPRNAGYSASKAFLSTFVEGLRVDLRGTGVSVTAIHPGFVRTPGTEKNAFEMPFLLECDDAVERIAAAIVAGAPELSFPWQASLVTRVSRWLPNAVWDRASAALAPTRDE